MEWSADFPVHCFLLPLRVQLPAHIRQGLSPLLYNLPPSPFAGDVTRLRVRDVGCAGRHEQSDRPGKLVIFLHSSCT